MTRRSQNSTKIRRSTVTVTKEKNRQLQFDQFLGDARTYEVVLGTFGDGEHLDYGIHIAVRRSRVVDGSPANKCIDQLARESTFERYRGPMIIYGMKQTSRLRRVPRPHLFLLSHRPEGYH